MLSTVKPRGDTSVAFVRLGYTSRSRLTATEYTVRPKHINMQGSELLRAMLSSDVFNL